MKVLAALGDGGVTVLEPSGRRTKTEDFTITPLDAPVQLTYALSLVSARALIEGVTYGFHAHWGRYANHYRPEIRYIITGPNRETQKQEEFGITEELRWTGQRPWNPLLVKYVFRKWMKDLDVVVTISKAGKALPYPETHTVVSSKT